MSHSEHHFTKQARASVKAGNGEANISYTLKGQPHSFTTTRVSGGLSQTLIVDDAGEVAVGWKYRAGLKPGKYTFLFEDLLGVAFYASVFDEYTGSPVGTLELTYELIGTEPDEKAKITGVITDASVSKGTDVLKFSGDFTYIFP